MATAIPGKGDSGRVAAVAPKQETWDVTDRHGVSKKRIGMNRGLMKQKLVRLSPTPLGLDQRKW